jgi:hypothetical protein
LLYERRFTIEGARQSLQAAAKGPKPLVAKRVQQDLFSADPLPDIRRELEDILKAMK